MTVKVNLRPPVSFSVMVQVVVVPSLLCDGQDDPLRRLSVTVPYLHIKIMSISYLLGLGIKLSVKYLLLLLHKTTCRSLETV